MARRAKIVQKGGGQAVRLPRSGIARRVIRELADEWSEEFLAALGAWKDDIERPRCSTRTA